MRNSSIASLQNLKSSYRPDIDGMRAIAILLVVAFHAFPTEIQGGFIGVDIFFVISGFLITGIINKELANGHFSITHFYWRRVRRIFPALLLVLISSLLFGWLLLFSDEYRELGKEVAAGALFLSNFLFSSESGYFDRAAELKPMLHLWSLSIEEQFYLLWPFILLIGFRLEICFTKLIAILILLSFALNIKVAFSSNQNFEAFYLPYTRFWELLVGGLLTSTYFKKIGLAFRTKYKLFSELFPCFGLLAIIFGAFMIHPVNQYPGILGLVPVFGALSIILSADSYLNQHFFSNRALVLLGLISYPLYLWHWPIFSFFRMVNGYHPNFFQSFLLVLFSILLAILTYLFIEGPFKNNLRTRLKLIWLMLAMLVVFAAGVVIYKFNGVPHRDLDRSQFVELFDNKIPEWRLAHSKKLFEKYRLECDFFNLEAYRISKPTQLPREKIDSSCFTRDSSKRNVVFIWGDSHAQHLNYGLSISLPKEDWQILQVASSGCLPSTSLNDSNSEAYCSHSNEFALQTIKMTRPEVVVVTQNDGVNSSVALAIATKMNELGVKKTIFVGPTPHWNSELPKIIARNLWFSTPERTFVGLNMDSFNRSKALKIEYNQRGLNYFDLMDIFCNKGDGCLTRIGSDRVEGMVSHDYGHLLPISSEYAAKNGLVAAIIAP